jgi:hypothetical protein
LTWEHLVLGGWFAFAFLRITLLIDPHWEDARKVPLLDRIVRPLSGMPGLCLWWTSWAVLFIGTIVLVKR